MFYNIQWSVFLFQKAMETKYKILPLNDIQGVAQTENARKLFYV